MSSDSLNGYIPIPTLPRLELPKIPPFSGLTDKRPGLHFIEDIENRFKVTATPDDEKLTYFPSFLKAQARTWFNISGPFRTWESLKGAFKDEFVNNDEPIRRDRFKSLKQMPGESVNKFRARLERESEDLNMADGDRKFALRSGLHEPLSIHVKNMYPLCHSYKEACAIARLKESQLKENSPLNVANKNLAMERAKELDEHLLSIEEDTTTKRSNFNSSIWNKTSSELSPTQQTATLKEHPKAPAGQAQNRNKASSSQSKLKQNSQEDQYQQERTQTSQNKQNRKRRRTNANGCYKCHGPHIAKDCPLLVCTNCGENHHFSYCVQHNNK